MISCQLVMNTAEAIASARVRARSSRAIVEVAISANSTTSASAGSSLRARPFQNRPRSMRPEPARSTSSIEVIR